MSLARRRCAKLGLVASVVVAAPVTGALAAWTSPGGGGAGAAATVMPGGSAPTASVYGTNVTISWPAASFQGGASVVGYTVRRIDAGTGAPATIGASCSGVVTSTSCTEQNVPAGSWVYTDTPVQQSWSGPQSPPGNTVSLGVNGASGGLAATGSSVPAGGGAPSPSGGAPSPSGDAGATTTVERSALPQVAGRSGRLPLPTPIALLQLRERGRGTVGKVVVGERRGGRTSVRDGFRWGGRGV